VTDRADWLIAVGVVVIVACLGAVRMAPNVIGIYHDDGIYVATAKSLAEGHGYRLIDIPGAPAQTKYPILYPLALALLWRLWPVFPQNAVLLQSFSVLCTALALALGYLYLVRVSGFSRLLVGVSAVICATSPWTLYFGTQTLSEPLFALMTMLMFFTAENTFRQSRRGRSGDFFRGAVIASPLLVRLVGVPFVGVLTLMLIRQPRRQAWVLVGILATVMPWAAWVFLQSKAVAVEGVARYYTADPYSSWWLTDPAIIANVLFKNLLWAARYTCAIPIQILSDSRFVIVAVVLGSAAWIVLCRHWRTRPILVFSMLAYLALVLLWPWPPLRFLVPISLVSTVCLVACANRGISLLPERARLPITVLGTAAVVVTNLGFLSADIAVVHETGYPQLVSDRPAFWRDYQQTFDWIRANTDRGDVLASGLDSMLYLYTGRRGIRPFEPAPLQTIYGSAPEPLGSPENFVSVLIEQSARFLVRLPMPIFVEEPHLNRLIDRVRAERPGCLEERYKNSRDARFVVYEVRMAMCRQ
jgi:hypothetical protein